MSQNTPERMKNIYSFVEIIHSRYFHKHVDHIYRQNSWYKVVSNYVMAFTQNSTANFPVSKNKWMIL